MAIVFAINDDAAVRESIASAVRAVGWRSEMLPDVHAFLSRPRELAPSCLVLDAELPQMHASDMQSLLSYRADLPVILTAKHPVLRAVVTAIKAGAVDFLQEPLGREILLTAIGAALERSREALTHTAEVHVLADRYASLSAREREVMAQVITGRLNKLIADDLGISEITVKSHRGRVMRKMQAASVPDLVNMAARLAPVVRRGSQSAQEGGARGLGCYMWGALQTLFPESPARRCAIRT